MTIAYPNLEFKALDVVDGLLKHRDHVHLPEWRSNVRHSFPKSQIGSQCDTLMWPNQLLYLIGNKRSAFTCWMLFHLWHSMNLAVEHSEKKFEKVLCFSAYGSWFLIFHSISLTRQVLAGSCSKRIWLHHAGVMW
jgi:hypothetical protein